MVRRKETPSHDKLAAVLSWLQFSPDISLSFHQSLNEYSGCHGYSSNGTFYVFATIAILQFCSLRHASNLHHSTSRHLTDNPYSSGLQHQHHLGDGLVRWYKFVSGWSSICFCFLFLTTCRFSIAPTPHFRKSSSRVNHTLWNILTNIHFVSQSFILFYFKKKTLFI